MRYRIPHMLFILLATLAHAQTWGCSALSICPACKCVVPADLDLDGDLDIVYSNTGTAPGVRVRLNNGNGMFDWPTLLNDIHPSARVFPECHVRHRPLPFRRSRISRVPVLGIRLWRLHIS